MKEVTLAEVVGWLLFKVSLAQTYTARARVGAAAVVVVVGRGGIRGGGEIRSGEKGGLKLGRKD